MVLYIRDCQDSTGKLLEIINEFGSVVVYKIHLQTSVAFLHTNNKHAELEIMYIFTFKIVSKIKYL